MDPNSHSIFSGDTSSTTIDPIFSNFTLQSLLTLNPSYFSDNFHHTLTDDSPPLPNFPESIDQTQDLFKKHFLVPKSEHPFNLPSLQEYLPFQPQQQQPFNFFPKYLPPFEPLHRLPQLRSPEPSNRKRLHSETTPTPSPPPPGKNPSLIPQSNLARQRRQKLSEKTRCLQKLMPWDKKMDQATLYEEAYKYVKFLQAQLSVLQSMPSYGVGNGGVGTVSGGVFDDLEKLNRNQALQILVNSPVAQTKLCERGYCVFSMEQFSLLRKLSEKRQQQQNFSEHASSKTFFH